MTTNPSDIENWLECNGQSITASAYPELVALVGATVPDFRGLFLRGVGGNSAALGTAQGDAIRNITGYGGGGGHQYGDDPSIPLNSNVNGAFWRSRNVMHGQHFPGQFYDYGDIHFDASRVVPTAAENRPVNKAVRYLIRAK